MGGTRPSSLLWFAMKSACSNSPIAILIGPEKQVNSASDKLSCKIGIGSGMEYMTFGMERLVECSIVGLPNLGAEPSTTSLSSVWCKPVGTVLWVLKIGPPGMSSSDEGIPGRGLDPTKEKYPLPMFTLTMMTCRNRRRRTRQSICCYQLVLHCTTPWYTSLSTLET